MKKFLLLSFAFLFSAHTVSAFTISPSTGLISDGMLSSSRASVEDIPGGGPFYWRVVSPRNEVSNIVFYSSSFYLGDSSGWTGITDWDVAGSWIVQNCDDDVCSNVVDSSVFVLSNGSFGPATAISESKALAQNVGLIVALVIAGILTLMAGLLGLGWGTRKVRQHITGGGEWDATVSSSGDVKFVPHEMTSKEMNDRMNL